MKIKFNREYLAILAVFAANGDTREYLNGFHVKPHPDQRGVILTACDGHRVVTIYDEYGIADDQYIFPITKELLDSSKKAKNKNKQVLNEIQIIDDKAYVLHSEEDVIDWFDIDNPDDVGRVHHVEYISNIGGTYPNLVRVFSLINNKKISSIGVNPKYIGDLAKTFNSKIHGVRLIFSGEENPIVAIGGFRKEIVAVINPLSDHDSEEEKIERVKLPDFVNFSGGDQQELNTDKDEITPVDDLGSLYHKVVEYTKITNEVSISIIQRKFRIGYSRTTQIIEQMEKNKVISSVESVGIRKWLVEQ